MVITAIGQTPDLSFLPAGSKIKTTKRGTFDVDSRSLATNVAGIFAGGDVRRGAGLMIEAIADGRKAAVAIDCYLRGEDLPPEPPQPAVADITETSFRVPPERSRQRGTLSGSLHSRSRAERAIPKR